MRVNFLRKHKRGLSVLSCVIAFFLITAGCATPLGGDWSDAVVQDWTLEKIDGRNAMANSRVTIDFSSDGRVVGHAGVNRYFTTYEKDAEGGLRFAPIGATRMYRDKPEGLMEQENRYLKLLESVDAYSVKQDRLTLMSDGKKVLVFEPTLSP